MAPRSERQRPNQPVILSGAGKNGRSRRTSNISGFSCGARSSASLRLCVLNLLVALSLAVTPPTHAEPPGVSHIFPAGAQRGTTVDFRVGGFYLHGHAAFEVIGEGLQATPEVHAVENF